MTKNTLQPDDVLSSMGTGSAQVIADRTIEAWEAVARVLVPLIGEKGFSILFARCIHLTRSAYPWLALDPVELGSAPFAGLRKILEGRSGADALAASRALMLTFHDSLSVLIGTPLTTAMLGAKLGRDPSPTKEIP